MLQIKDEQLSNISTYRFHSFCVCDFEPYHMLKDTTPIFCLLDNPLLSSPLSPAPTTIHVNLNTRAQYIELLENDTPT